MVRQVDVTRRRADGGDKLCKSTLVSGLYIPANLPSQQLSLAYSRFDLILPREMARLWQELGTYWRIPTGIGRRGDDRRGSAHYPQELADCVVRRPYASILRWRCPTVNRAKNIDVVSTQAYRNS